MKCKIICDLLPLYIDDVCSDETKEAVEEHLKTCGPCRMEYEKMKADISINKAEDLDEKELMEKGKETMTEYVKEKLYRKCILGDTFLNLLIAICVAVCASNEIMARDIYYYEELLLLEIPFGIFSVSDIIYWVSYLIKRKACSSVIIDTLCKASIWMKLVMLVCAIAAAAVVGFYALFDGGGIVLL